MSHESHRVEPGYEPVASAFYATVADGAASGAAVSVWREGRPVVSLGAGTADPATGAPFTTDTLVPVASVTKGLASLVIARLVESGALPSYDTEIGAVWPEFGAYGKGGVTIGDVLAHRAGVPAPRISLTKNVYLDSLATADVLAAQEPLWEPGAWHQYHTFTHGALTAKLANIATGRTLGTLFADDIAGPLGVEAWIGLPEDRVASVTKLVPETETSPSPAEDPDPAPGTPAYWAERAINFGSGVELVPLLESAEALRAELPGVNGIASATAVAKIWSSVVTETDGYRLISDQTVEAVRRTRSAGAPAFGGPPPYQSWGAGVMVPSHWEWYLTETSLGHDGAHGQVAFADPYTKIGFAYLTNQIGDWERGKSIIAALSRVVF